jgi:hypothetical protein
LNLAADSPTDLWLGKRRLPMMRLTISAIAAVALIVVAITMLQPRSPSVVLSAAAMPPLVELHTMVGVRTLPIEEVEDQSLVYPMVPKR